jgi:hypothetical protein
MHVVGHQAIALHPEPEPQALFPQQFEIDALAVLDENHHVKP